MTKDFKPFTFIDFLRRRGWSLVVMSLVPIVFTTTGAVIAAREFHKLEVENARLRKACTP